MPVLKTQHASPIAPLLLSHGFGTDHALINNLFRAPERGKRAGPEGPIVSLPVLLALRFTDPAATNT